MLTTTWIWGRRPCRVGSRRGAPRPLRGAGDGAGQPARGRGEGSAAGRRGRGEVGVRGVLLEAAAAEVGEHVGARLVEGAGVAGTLRAARAVAVSQV